MTGRTHKRLFAIGITITLLAGTTWAAERTWTDTTGKFSVTAELVKVTGGYPTPFVPQWEVLGDKVVLRLQDGKMITVPLVRLRKEDQQFARESAERAMVVKIGTPPPAVAPFDSDQAKAHQKAWANYLGVPVEITNSLGMKLNLIPPGEFLMGSPESEAGRYDDETQHLVRISKPFYLSACEVQAVHHEKINVNPFGVTAQALNKGETKPVVWVTWKDAGEFCDKLSEQEGVEYRLPTEAEWEYACRAGTTTAWCFGDDLSQLGEYAWHRGNSEDTTHPVGELKPNPWGLFDMHGNVWEWCQDWHGPYQNLQVVSDPTGAASGDYGRVLRGGAFFYLPMNVRAAYRDNNPPDYRFHGFGFRLAMTYPLSP